MKNKEFISITIYSTVYTAQQNYESNFNKLESTNAMGSFIT
jgi:hypothetical protein